MRLASIYSMPVFLNKEGIKQAQAFIAACPSALDGYRQFAGIDDRKVLASYAEKLHALLQARTDDPRSWLTARSAPSNSKRTRHANMKAFASWR
jgi:hypothetical protein